MSDMDWPAGDDDNEGGATPPPPPPPPPGGAAPPPPYGDTVAVSTPGLGMRFLARILDGFVVGIPMAILLAILPGVTIGGLVGNALFGIAGFAYYVYMESSMGRTVGKMAINAQVTAVDGGGNLSMEASAMRNWWLLLGVFGGVPILGILTGLASLVVVIYIAVTISGDPNGRGWHDQLGKATVVSA